MKALQYVSDEKGKPTAVIIPIELWQELLAERETAYLLKSKKMKDRLLEARQHHDGITLDTAREKLGV